MLVKSCGFKVLVVLLGKDRGYFRFTLHLGFAFDFHAVQDVVDAEIDFESERIVPLFHVPFRSLSQ